MFLPLHRNFARFQVLPWTVEDPVAFGWKDGTQQPISSQESNWIVTSPTWKFPCHSFTIVTRIGRTRLCRYSAKWMIDADGSSTSFLVLGRATRFLWPVFFTSCRCYTALAAVYRIFTGFLQPLFGGRVVSLCGKKTFSSGCARGTWAPSSFYLATSFSYILRWRCSTYIFERSGANTFCPFSP